MAENKECANCARLEAEVSDLKNMVQSLLKRVAELEDELRKGKRQTAPFSTGKSILEKKKPGRKRGDGNFAYKAAAEKIHSHQSELLQGHCPDCASELKRVKKHTNWQSDLPILEVKTTEYQTESGWCPKCRKHKRSVCEGQLVTAGGSAAHGLGPRLQALSGMLKHRLGVTYRKQVELYDELLGLKVSASGLLGIGHRVSQKLKGVYEEIFELLYQATSVHADETGWRINTLSAWMWVFTSPTATAYLIRQSRGHGVIQEALGTDFPGVLHSDGHMAYNHRELNDWNKQQCLAHLLRRLSKLAEQKQKGAIRFAQQARALLRNAVELHSHRQDMDSEAYASQVSALKNRLKQLIAPQRRLTDVDNLRMANFMRKHEASLLRFLDHLGVEATNNRAERAIRPAVIARKVGQCNKNPAGADTHAIQASVWTTLKQQGHKLIDSVEQLLLSDTPSFATLGHV